MAVLGAWARGELTTTRVVNWRPYVGISAHVEIGPQTIRMIREHHWSGRERLMAVRRPDGRFEVFMKSTSGNAEVFRAVLYRALCGDLQVPHKEYLLAHPSVTQRHDDPTDRRAAATEAQP